MPLLKPKTQYDYATHKRVQLKFLKSDPNAQSKTNQSDKDSTDINKIMKRYEKSGLITDLITGVPRTPNYGDFTGIPDYHTLQSTLARTRQAFEALPADTRTRFGNDPHNLVNFLADPKNDGEAVDLNLKDKSVLLTALDDDGTTKILPSVRAAKDKLKADRAKGTSPPDPAPSG